MNEKHCVSLELAKQIQEAGFKKETEFWWTQHKEQEQNPNYRDCAMVCDKGTLEMYPSEFWNLYPAPLATEILEELPFRLREVDDDYWLWVTKLKHGGYEVRYRNSNHSRTLKIVQDDSLPNALAKMWLYLHKEPIQ